MDPVFYLVWNPNNPQTPRVQHPSEHEARKEAERLARLEPGQKFYILKSVAHCAKKEVFWSDDDIVPF